MKPALRIVAIVEAASFLLLLAASFVKRVLEGPDAVPVMGMVHGLLFVTYVFLTILVAVDEKWRLGRTLLTLLCAVIPFGGFIADRRLIDQPAGAGA